LALIEERVEAASNEATNVGSMMELWESAFPLGPWTLADAQPTAAPTDFGDSSAYYQKYLVARELGNGVEFGGSSGDSNTEYVT
jgi:hypothetical protein